MIMGEAVDDDYFGRFIVYSLLTVTEIKYPHIVVYSFYLQCLAKISEFIWC